MVPQIALPTVPFPSSLRAQLQSVPPKPQGPLVNGHVTFEMTLTTKPMIAVTKRNEKIAWTRVTRRILIEVTVTSDV